VKRWIRRISIVKGKPRQSYFVILPKEVVESWLSDETWDRYVVVEYLGEELRIKPLKFVETEPREVE